MRAMLVLFILTLQVIAAHAAGPCSVIPKPAKGLVSEKTKGYVPVMIELKIRTRADVESDAYVASMGKYRFWIRTAESIRYDKYGMLSKAEACVFPTGGAGLHKLYVTLGGKSQPQDTNETIRTYRAFALLPKGITQSRPEVGAHYTINGESVAYTGIWGTHTAPNKKRYPTLTIAAGK